MAILHTSPTNHSASPLQMLYPRPGLSVQLFRARYWQRAPLVGHGGLERLAILLGKLDPDDIERVVAQHKGDVSATLAARNGQVHRVQGLGRQPALAMYHAGGALQLDGFHHSVPSAAWLPFQDDLARQLGLPARFLGCAAVAARRPYKGAAFHGENRDLFVVQLRGRQRWRIGINDEAPHPLTALHPWAPSGPTALRKRQQPLETIDLRAGSVLYLPRNHWYETELMSDASFALAIAAWRPSWLELLEVALHNHLAGSPAWREPVDRAWGTADDQLAAAGQLGELVAVLRDELAGVDPRALLAASDPSLSAHRYARNHDVALELDDGDGHRAIRIGGAEQVARITCEDVQIAEVVCWIGARDGEFTVADVISVFPGLSGERALALCEELKASEFLDSLPVLAPVRRLGPSA
jgi:ribosomal protein L16 Arg81 hydroxylase